ncbi:mu-adaptin 3 [Coprinopsis cinerea okayama7|uniref:Mu-adaptin 3 n=1 Tax=Coprinopsis cinerea (strain Okayama-7 / 130 / ATCC MYA-4618 / FGSC 9003) TaxID=240176 RepID=D6RMJ8_COPC7|nr:mu-adaptin 3 [Coprinopsis cinerea okayama7\|eukprot:XP_002911231.1 mu-adaptin 3 [Coprinopsis cinerea okayama7\
MGIDGLILLDSAGRSIIQSGFRSTTSTYPFLHVEAFNAAAANAQRPTDIDSVIYVQHPTNVDIPSACCHVSVGDLRILCPISGNVDPLVGFSFLRTFIDILQEYFGDVSVVTVKENFDIVYQLLEEILDSVGHPLTTSHNALRDIVLPPSLLTKLLNAASANLAAIGAGGTAPGLHTAAHGPFSSPIPWRRAGVKYASNEIYFDMVEELRAIVNKHGVPLSSNVFGQIEGNCRLSGTPDCLLTFSNSQVLADCAFHPCVRLQRWSKDRALSFIPPDGHFVLAEYRFAPNAGNSALRFGTSSTTAVKDQIPMPFVMKARFEFDGNNATFEISFTSRLTTRVNENVSLENISVELNLGEGVHGIKCVASRESGGLGRGLSVETSTASWSFDQKKKVLRWEIPRAPPSTHWTLQGSFTAPTAPPRPSRAMQIRFEIPSRTFSQLKVEQLRITGEGYKPYKGVRGRSCANVEWRW